jgi:hypothetical protein
MESPENIYRKEVALPYTPSARQLASALGVMLLHHSELAGFRERVEGLFSALILGEASA